MDDLPQGQSLLQRVRWDRVAIVFVCVAIGVFALVHYVDRRHPIRATTEPAGALVLSDASCTASSSSVAARVSLYDAADGPVQASVTFVMYDDQKQVVGAGYAVVTYLAPATTTVVQRTVSTTRPAIGCIARVRDLDRVIPVPGLATGTGGPSTGGT